MPACTSRQLDVAKGPVHVFGSSAGAVIGLALITLAGGRDSRAHFPYRPAATLAARWNRRVVDFPGGHLGYWTDPIEFAATLADVMAE